MASVPTSLRMTTNPIQPSSAESSTALARNAVGFIRLQTRLQQTIGHTFAWLSLTLVLLTAFVVFDRYGLDSGSIALQETLVYNHAILFMMGMAYTLQQGGHVRVDVFYSRMSPNRQAWVDLLGNLFLALPTMLFVLWVSWDYVAASWEILEGSAEAGGLPFLYLLKSVIPVMGGLMTLQILADATESALKLFQPEQPVVQDWLAQRTPSHEEMV